MHTEKRLIELGQPFFLPFPMPIAYYRRGVEVVRTNYISPGNLVLPSGRPSETVDAPITMTFEQGFLDNLLRNGNYLEIVKVGGGYDLALIRQEREEGVNNDWRMAVATVSIGFQPGNIGADVVRRLRMGIFIAGHDGTKSIFSFKISRERPWNLVSDEVRAVVDDDPWEILTRAPKGLLLPRDPGSVNEAWGQFTLAPNGHLEGRYRGSTEPVSRVLDGIAQSLKFRPL